MHPSRAALALVLLAGAALPGAADAAEGDARAMTIAHAVMDSLGGAKRWEALGGIRWTFAVEVNDTMRAERRHAWDKHKGWHRVEGKTRDGTPFCFIHNLHTAEGKAWMAGQPIEGDSLEKLLARAKTMWTNDTYWMLMPYKLLDPGVHLALEEPAVENRTTYDRLALSFDAGVGETPGDRYWVFVERGTNRVRMWEHVLQGQEPPPVRFTWEGWELHDGLWFPTAHRRDGVNIMTHDVETVSAFPAGVFSAP
jgi:hypothetical protein